MAVVQAVPVAPAPVEAVLVERQVEPRRQQVPEHRPLHSRDRKRMQERLLRRHRPRFLHASMCT